MKTKMFSVKHCIILYLFVFSIVTVLCTPLYARGMTPEDVARLQSVYEISISSDGSQIAYTELVRRNPFVHDNGSAWRELHVIDPEGNSNPFITGEVKITKIDWSPDDRYISYLSERNDDDKNSLYVIPSNGGESRKIIEFKTDIKEYVWSHDNRHIAFLAKDTASDKLDDLEDIGFDQEIYEEDWRHVRVWIIDSQKDKPIPRKLELPGSASTLTWSPDGKLLALALAPTPLIDDRYMSRVVHMVDPQNGTIVHKFDNTGKLGQLVWSPNSKYLAIIAASELRDPKEGEIYLLDASSGDMNPVLTKIDGHVRRIGWKDNNTIVYLLYEHAHSVIGMINKDGTDNKRIFTGTKPVFTDMDLSKKSNMLALAGSAYDHPSELFSIQLKGKNPQRLTNSNLWLNEIDFGRQEVLTYPARDGLEIEGILIYPVDYIEGGKYPLIMYVHGGPESHRRDAWLTSYSHPGQIASSKGYMVFYPNYRGSTGRGVEFSKMGQADYAGGEFDDLVDAIDHLDKLGLIDRTKVGITGGSYGGYATAWASTALSEHFAAGVMSVGVSDLISKFGTTDIPYEMYYIHAQYWPWEKWQWYLEQSPIYHAGNSRTPLLIMHGEDDTRVHPSQSMELYRYLKVHGNTPVRLVFYKDEGHGNSKAASRYDFNLRMLRWFDHYLKGLGGEPPDYKIDYNQLKPEESENEENN